MASTNEELASALKMFSRFFDLIHQPLAVINERGEYVYYNQESADLDGYSIEQAMGKHMLDVYPSMKENQSTMLSSLKDGVEYIGHYQIYYNARGRGGLSAYHRPALLQQGQYGRCHRDRQEYVRRPAITGTGC